MKIMAISALVLGVALSGAAGAATYRFDLTAAGTNDPTTPNAAQYDALPASVSLSSGGLSVVATAQSYSFISAAATPGGIEIFQAYFVENEKLARYDSGAGVIDRVGDANTLESSVMTVFEYIWLTFSAPVSITGLEFGAFEGGDDAFNIIEDRSGDNVFGAGDFISLDQAIDTDVAVSGFGTMTSFGILAPGPYASFHFASVTVETAPVPLPAGLPMLAAGMIGLAALRRGAGRA